MPNEQITVLLLDHHYVVRAGYRRILEESRFNISVVAEADNGKTGCVLFEEFKPDVVILDLNMPGIDGLETMRRIKAKSPAAHILVFSMHSNEILIRRVLQAGATGYLTKQGGLDQMVRAVREVSQGSLYIDQGITSNEPSSHFNLSSEDIISSLTKREFQLFKLFAEGNSTKEIGNILSISPKTVGVHHTNIMKKLKVNNPAQMLYMAMLCNIIP